MDELLEEVSTELPPAQALQAFQTVLRIADNIVSNPSEAKYRSLAKAKVSGKLPGRCMELLKSCGFQDLGDTISLPFAADLSQLEYLKEIVDIFVMSFDDVPESKRARGSEAPADTTGDAEMAERMAGEEAKEEPKNIDFERFREEDVLVDADAVERINEYCRASGEPYVDPQFPPTNASIYVDPADANTWTCFACRNRSELPPLPPLPKSREEALQLEEDFKKVVCSSCGEHAPFVVKVKYFNRVCQWLRPAVRCAGCELLYSHLPAGRDLIPRMCPHYLRDEISNTTVGTPWKLIRGEARAEDVCQGGLGNCWFAGALSVVARVPALIDHLFETKEFNPNGAYQLQLCHAGQWRRILIDDLLPTSQIFEGYMDGTMVYYSRGGSLCYLHCARRQLWVPLVEKAAAKLFGCYAGLSGGTVGEALALMTGFPTDRIVLYLPKEARRAKQEKRDAIAAHRTQLLLQGHDPSELDVQEDSDDDIENADLMWSKVLSANESGYLMGMGCTEEGCEKTKHHIVEEMGLQAPHAYGIMDAREIVHNGKLLRMVKVRNPWGERAPRTWKGRWGKDSPEWTFELKLALGVVNRSNINMDDDMSVFWMQFEDVREYFAAVEVCRIHVDWQTCREVAWLPSAVGPGEAFDLTVFHKSQVDIALWQERHIAREGSVGGKSTNIDVGFAVLRRRAAADGEAYDCIEYVRRNKEDHVSKEVILDGGYVYRIVPLSFGMIQEMTPRKAVLAVHAAQAIELKKVPSSWHCLANALSEGCRRFGRRRPIPNARPGISSYTLPKEYGATYVVENTSNAVCALQVDASDSLGCVSSRDSLMAIVMIPPRSQQVVMALTIALGASRAGTLVEAQALPDDAAGFALAGDGLHASLPLLPPAGPPPPDEDVVRRAPPPRLERNQTNQSEEMSDEEMLKLAMAMSHEQPPQANGHASVDMEVEEDDDMAAAIRMSMESVPVVGAAALAPKAVPAPARPSPAPSKEEFNRLVRQFFEQHQRAGMAPNEAAVKAMEDAKRELLGRR